MKKIDINSYGFGDIFKDNEFYIQDHQMVEGLEYIQRSGINVFSLVKIRDNQYMRMNNGKFYKQEVPYGSWDYATTNVLSDLTKALYM